jgi:hypothetical protein
VVVLEYAHVVPLSLETYAALVPAADTGVEPTCQLLFVVAAWFTRVHPFDANVAPFSKPPSPVGDISVVCAVR